MAAAGAGARTCTFPGCSAVALVILTDAIVRCDDHTKLCGDLHDYEGDCETSTRRCKTMATRTDLVNCLAIIGTVQQCVAKIDAFAESGGAWIIGQRSFSPLLVAERLESLLRLPETLVRAAAGARDAGKPDAAERLADLVAAQVAAKRGNMRPVEKTPSRSTHVLWEAAE